MDFKPITLGAVVFLLICCATPRKPLVAVQQRGRLDRESGVALASQLDPKLSFVRPDPKVEDFLNRTADRLLVGWVNALPQPSPLPSHSPSPSPSPALPPDTATVLLIHPASGKWVGYALPGIRVYLPAEELKHFEYENILAAEIAFQLGHIVKDQTAKYLAANKKDRTDFFGEKGLFTYSDDAQSDAADAAFEMLYAAGYDPRGLLNLWELYKNNPAKSPLTSDQLENLTDDTRRNIALKAPLRNPIVRSEEFLTIRQRILKSEKQSKHSADRSS